MALHATRADVGCGCGGIFGVEEGGDGGVELALGCEDEVDGIAAGSVASGVGGDVVGGCFGLQAGVGGGDGKAAGAHHGKVDDVVTDVSELVEGDAGAPENVVDGFHLVGLALVDELKPEVAGADGDGGGFALGDNADTQTAEAREGDTEAVVCGEALEFEAVLLAVGVGLGEEEELAVGENAVYVEDEDFDVAGAVFCGGTCREGHALMIAWRVLG